MGNESTEQETLPVTQADRDAVQAFHRKMLDRLMSDVKSARPKLGDDEGDAGTLVQAFARHRADHEPRAVGVEGWRLGPDGDPVPLSECPPGPFEFNGGLGFKTEYGAAKWLPERDAFTVSHWPDPYCLDTGEAFWGGVSEQAARASLVVQPLAAAQSPAPTEGWQDIASAPKDGSTIILWAEIDGGERGAPYGPVMAAWVKGCAPGSDDLDIGFGEDGGWLVSFTDNCIASAERPTHWMPLPTAPAAALPSTQPQADAGSLGEGL